MGSLKYSVYKFEELGEPWINNSAGRLSFPMERYLIVLPPDL
jgi:hypothetical protein